MAMISPVSALLALLDYLLDRALPPPGGPQEVVDARFSAIVEALENAS